MLWENSDLGHWTTLGLLDNTKSRKKRDFLGLEKQVAKLNMARGDIREGTWLVDKKIFGVGVVNHPANL